MRRLAPLLVSLAIAAVACGSSSSSTQSAATSKDANTTVAAASGPNPVVTGAFGTKPTITLPAGAAPTQLVTTVLSTGTGPTIAKGDTLVANYVGIIWPGGKQFDSSFDRGQPASFAIGVGQVIPGWDKGLVGKTVGSRVLLVIPPTDGYGAGGNSRAGIKGTDTLVFVVDLVNTVGKTLASGGVPVDLGADAATLPKVTGDSAVKPTIAIPAGVAAPTALITKVLVQGGGPAVVSGQQITVQYVGVVWATGKQFDASWDNGGSPVSFGIGTGQVIPGWDEGLVGQKTGSRVLLVIPPAKGYGSAGQPQAGIKGTDTLVFVVDIIAAN